MSMGLHSHSRTSHSNGLYMVGHSNWLHESSIAVSMGLGGVEGAGLAGH